MGDCIAVDHEKPTNTGDGFKIETAQNGEDNLKNESRHVQIDERNEIALLLFLTDVGSLIFRIAATWLCSKFSFGDILVALWLSPGMGRRIRALMGIPLLMMSSAAIFTFFGGNQVGYIFLYRLLYEGAPTSVLIICAAFYCFCQTSMEMERWRRRKAERSADSKQKVKVQ